LGPVFNAVSCGVCHFEPVTGGGGANILEERYGRTDAFGNFDPLAETGGSLLQLFSLKHSQPDVLPAQANTVALRRTTPLFGLGIIEGVADADIEAQAVAEPPAIRGEVSHVNSLVTGAPEVGRFGWKCQVGDL